jgi:cytochrome d ubiquinol oxidase subunit I
VVFGLMKTADAASPNVPATTVLFSLIVYTLVYGVLIVADAFLLKKYALAGVTEAQKPEQIADPALD